MLVAASGEPTAAVAAAAAGHTGGGELAAAPPAASGGEGTPEAPASSSSISAHPRGPMLGSSPVHTEARPSYLSTERPGQEQHPGLINLVVILTLITIMANCSSLLGDLFSSTSPATCLVEDALLQYGRRFSPFSLLELGGGVGNLLPLQLVLGFGSLLLFMAVALGTEKWAAQLLGRQEAARAGLEKQGLGGTKQAKTQLAALLWRHDWALFLVNVVNTSAVLAVPCHLVITSPTSSPLPSGVLIMLAIVLWMKLVSYAHCNWELRWARRRGVVQTGERGSPDTPDWALLQYPENVACTNLLYFALAPTLCYQANYPRSSSVRVGWLARRVAELVVMLTLLCIITSQYIVPGVQSSVQLLQQADWWGLVQHLLQLAPLTTAGFISMFYALFHVWLNILAELLRFGDREFYRAWWNAATVEEFWRLWNMPVHKWLLRHCCHPAIRAGLPNMAALGLTFFISAVAHELALSVPLQMLNHWAFLGMMLQVPLVILPSQLKKRLNSNNVGNVCFWFTFCIVGQPLVMMLYFRDFISNKG